MYMNSLWSKVWQALLIISSFQVNKCGPHLTSSGNLQHPVKIFITLMAGIFLKLKNWNKMHLHCIPHQLQYLVKKNHLTQPVYCSFITKGSWTSSSQGSLGQHFGPQQGALAAPPPKPILSLPLVLANCFGAVHKITFAHQLGYNDLYGVQATNAQSEMIIKSAPLPLNGLPTNLLYPAKGYKATI